MFGNLTLNSAGTKTALGNFTVKGTLNISQGVLDDAGKQVTANGNVYIAPGYPNGHTSSVTGGTITLSGGSLIHTLTGNGEYGNLTLNDNQGADMGASFTTTGTLTLTNGAFAIGGNTLTLNGPAIIQTAGTMTTTSGSNLTFGPGISNTNSGLFIPGSVNTLGNLTINIAPANIVTLDGSILLNSGTGLTLTSGLVAIGSNNLTFATGSNVGGSPSVNSMVLADAASGNTGQVMKQFSVGTPPSFTFPIGDNSGSAPANNPGLDYSPVTLSYSSNSIQRTIGVKVTDGQQPDDGTSNNYISRYWSFTDNQAGTYAYNLSVFYSTNYPSDLVGTQSTANINRWNGSAWQQYVTTYPASGFTITNSTTTPVNQTTAPLGGSDFTARVNTAATYTWIPASGSADWTVATNWTPSRVSPFSSDILLFNNAGTSTAFNVPTQTVGQISVTNGTNISLQTTGPQTLTLGYVSGPANVLTVDATSTLQLSSSGANSLYIALTNLTSPVPVTSIAGNILINANGSNTNTVDFTGSNYAPASNVITGTITNAGVFTAGNFKMGVNSVYNHTRDGGAIPYFGANWDPTSTCNITGIVSTSPSGAGGQTFGKFIYNCPNQTAAAIELQLQSNTTFAGNFTLVSTGTPSTNTLVMSNWGNNFNINFGASAAAPADLIIQGGTLNLNDNVNNWYANFVLFGNYNQTGGTVTVTTGGVQYIYFANNAVLPATYNYIQSGSSTVTNTNLISYAVNSGATITLQNNFPNVGTGRTFTVSGALMCGTNVVSGAGTFTLAANPAILGIGSANGINTAITASGNIQTTNINYSSGSNYIYNGNVAQSTGNGLTGSVNSLTIDNTSPSGLVNLTSPVTVSSTLTLDQGILELGSNNLTLANIGLNAIAGNTNSVTNMIAVDGSGQLIKNYPSGASSAFTYPIGDNTTTPGYSPVSIGITSNNNAGNIGVNLVNNTPPNIGAVTSYLKRYFTFSTSMSSYTYTLDYNYPSSDIVGTESVSKYSVYNGTTWTSFASAAASGAMTVTGLLNQTTAPLTAAYTYAGLQSSTLYYYYRSHQNGDWNNVTTWEYDTDPAFSNPQTPAPAAPTSSNCISVWIQSIHNVTVSGNNTAVTAPELLVDGTLTNQTTGNSASITTTGSFLIRAGGTYNHARDGGTIPTATWALTSTCNISGVSSNNPNGMGTPTTFGNFTYSSPGLVGAFGSAMTIAGNLMTTAGTLSLGNNIISVAGNVTDNGTINGSAGGTLLMNGSAAQSISGTGNWTSGYLSNLTINNSTNSVISINSNLTLQTGLNLYNGVLSGSGTLTLGIGASSTLTTNITNGTISSSLSMAYSMTNVTYNINYNNTASYTTSGELPSLSSAPSAGGAMTIGVAGASSQPVVLGNDGTINAVIINNNTNSILRLNGHTLAMSGNYAVSCCWNYYTFYNTGTFGK